MVYKDFFDFCLLFTPLFFSAFLLFCFSVFLLLCFSAVLLLRFSCFCFSALQFSRFFASTLLYLLLCFFASRFFFCFSVFCFSIFLRKPAGKLASCYLIGGLGRGVVAKRVKNRENRWSKPAAASMVLQGNVPGGKTVTVGLDSP